MRDNVVIVTTTMYPTKNTRFKLALAMLEEAQRMGYWVHVWDASPKEIRREFGCFENVQLYVQDASKPMYVSRIIAFDHALQSLTSGGAIVWTEPEKTTLPTLLSECTMPVLMGYADLVVIGRNSLDSYPEIHRYFETLGNHFFGCYTGFPCDAWFAPRVFNARAGKFFVEYDGRYGGKWDCLFIPVVQAVAAGLNIEEVKIDFTYPPAQRIEEEWNLAMHDKRLEQFDVLVRAIREESKRLGLPRPRA